jgi:hypothetical protein
MNIEKVLRLDDPWPLREVLSQLIEAVNHLHHDHNCDRHGYEEDRQAVEAAREILRYL